MSPCPVCGGDLRRRACDRMFVCQGCGKAWTPIELYRLGLAYLEPCRGGHTIELGAAPPVEPKPAIAVGEQGALF